MFVTIHQWLSEVWDGEACLWGFNKTSNTNQMMNNTNNTFYILQVKFCKRNPGFMDSVRLGAVRAIDECQYQFRQRRWNCSSLQDTMNSQIDLIKAHLGSKMTDSDLSGLKLTGLPSLPSSSLYSQQSLMGGGPPQHGLYDPEPTINAMFNSYTFKEKPRRSRNVRRRDRGRSRKGKPRKSFK